MIQHAGVLFERKWIKDRFFLFIKGDKNYNQYKGRDSMYTLVI